MVCTSSVLGITNTPITPVAHYRKRLIIVHSYKGGNSFEYVKTLTKMLEKLDAEKFCSGHSEITDRKGIINLIKLMKKRQEKIKALIEKNKSLEDIKKEFEENENRLIEVIYNEIK